MANTSGIYKITNKTNGKYYIGSSSNIFGNNGRWKCHKRQLQMNSHHNNYLQRSWNKYGSNNFDFIVLEEILPERLIETEQKYLDIAKTEKNKCYNLTFIAGKIEMTPEIKEKISLTLTGRYRGKNSPHYGKCHTKRTREKMSNVKRGKISPNKGKKMTLEQKKKIRQSLLKIKNQISEKLSKNWIFVSPKGRITKIHNLLDFCNKNNLSHSHMWGVYHGQRKSHKGWNSLC